MIIFSVLFAPGIFQTLKDENKSITSPPDSQKSVCVENGSTFDPLFSLHDEIIFKWTTPLLTHY